MEWTYTHNWLKMAFVRTFAPETVAFNRTCLCALTRLITRNTERHLYMYAVMKKSCINAKRLPQPLGNRQWRHNEHPDTWGMCLVVGPTSGHVRTCCGTIKPHENVTGTIRSDTTTRLLCIVEGTIYSALWSRKSRIIAHQTVVRLLWDNHYENFLWQRGPRDPGAT